MPITSHPVTILQNFMLGCLADPSCSDGFRDHWILTTGLLVQPRIDKRRLRRALDRLVARHDSLRIRFEGQVGNWRALIHDQHPIPLEETTLDEPDDAAFAAAIRAIARAPMDALNGQLAEAVLVHCGPRGDAIIFRIHHMLADGSGMITLAEDLLKFLLNLPVTSRVVSHADFLYQWQYAQGARRDGIEAYWAKSLADFPPAPNVGRKAKGLAPLVNTVGWTESEQVKIRVSPASRQACQKTALESGHAVDVHYYTAFMQAMCEQYDLAELACQVAVARAEPALAGYCGDRVSLPILRYRPDETRVFDRKVDALRQDLITAIAHLPSDAARRATPSDAALIDAGAYPRQFMTKTPRAETRQKLSMFQAGLSAPVGTPVPLGPYTLTKLDVGTRSLGTCELTMNVAEQTDPAALYLGYDADAYDRGEITRLAHRICDTAGLDFEGLEFYRAL